MPKQIIKRNGITTHGLYAQKTLDEPNVVSLKSSKARPELTVWDVFFWTIFSCAIGCLASFISIMAFTFLMGLLSPVMPILAATVLTSVIIAIPSVWIMNNRDLVFNAVVDFGFLIKERLESFVAYVRQVNWKEKLAQFIKYSAIALFCVAAFVGLLAATIACALAEFFVLSAAFTLFCNPVTASIIALGVTLLTLGLGAFFFGTYPEQCNAKLYALSQTFMAGISSLGVAIRGIAASLTESCTGLFSQQPIHEIEMQPLTGVPYLQDGPDAEAMAHGTDRSLFDGAKRVPRLQFDGTAFDADAEPVEITGSPAI